MDSGHVLDVCSPAGNPSSLDEQTCGCKIESCQQIPSLQEFPVIFSEVALSYGSHRKQVNNKDFVALLAHIFSKLELSPTSGYKGQSDRPGTGQGSGTHNTHSTEPYRGLVVDSTPYADSFGSHPQYHQKQIRKRLRDDDGSFPPNKLPTHDEEDSARELLCPFYVGDRHFFHKCSKRRFKRTSDVRQHIWRVHIQALHCPTCGEIFDNGRPHDSLNSERLNRHIAARTCHTQQFNIPPGITTEQFDNITEIASQRNRHRPSAVERWLRMWRVIYPGVDDPESPYSSGETDLVQGMLEVRSAIENDQSRAFLSGTPMTNFGPREWSIIDCFIGAARQFQRGHNRATTQADPLQRSSGEPASIHTVQGHSTEPPTNQAGGHGLAADPLAQSHAPRMVQPSNSQDPDWTGIPQPEFGQGSGQPLANQELTWDFFGLSDQYPWDSYRPN